MAEEKSLLERIHEVPKKELDELLDFPAHIHHSSYLMKDPPSERKYLRQELDGVLKHFEIKMEDTVLSERLCYGQRTFPDGERLIIRWETHTEYYSYQTWHIPKDKNRKINFGPIDIPGYFLPVCPLGERVCALDIIISTEKNFDPRQIDEMIPGKKIHGSKIFDGKVEIRTNFKLDQHSRERYMVFSSSPDDLKRLLPRVVECISMLENYYHLILLPLPKFSFAVDEIFKIEKKQLEKRRIITEQLGEADSNKLQGWLQELTEALMEVNRLSESMRYHLSSAFPYDLIIRTTLDEIDEKQVDYLPTLRYYMTGRIKGIADGYQRLISRIEAAEKAFEGMIAILRTRIELQVQKQNLSLLESVDKTIKVQVHLQKMVEGLSVIVITYYLTSLAGYLFKLLESAKVIPSATVATVLFIPVAAITVLLITRKAAKLLEKE